LTEVFFTRNNRRVKKSITLVSSAIAVCIALAFPTSSDARPRSKKKAAHRSASVTAKGPSRHAPKRTHAKHVIRQNDHGEVVLDRVDAAGRAVGVAGGVVVPPEMHNYPPSPLCTGVDVVLEAHVHEPEADAPEGDAPEGQPAEVSQAASTEPPAGAAASLSRIARKVGSFFRPKSSESEVRPSDVDLTELVSNRFMIPVEGVDAEKLRDSFLSSRGRHAQHLAIDIGAPRGTPIVATTDGEITQIKRERRGGKTIYQKDASGQYLLFYCHLSKYADDLSVGRKVKRGDVIGYVGSTGHVIGGPHLHFSITRVPEDGASFKKGLAINPYLLFLAEVP